METFIVVWIGAIMLIIFALYYTLFLSKYDCKVTVFEKRGGTFVKHDQDYKGIIKTATNQSKTQTVLWLNIAGIKAKFIPSSNDFNITTKGKKNLTVAWYGGNDIRVIKPSLRNFELIKKLGNGKYEAVKNDNPNLEITHDRYKIISADIDDELERLYNSKKWWDDYKPHIMLAILGIFIVAMVYMSTNAMKENSDKQLTISKTLTKALDGWTTQKVDANTEIRRSIPNEPENNKKEDG